jgi:hypothetical protein
MWAAIAAIGGLILGGIGLISSSKREKEALELQEEAARLQLEQDIITLKQDIAETGGVLATTRTAIAETETGIADVEDWLTLYPAYAEKEKTELELVGRRQYRELMENYGMLNVLAGATGRATAGTSMAVKGEQAREDVVSFVGEDLTFDLEGGLYGMTWAELLQNLEAEYTGKERQLEVLKTSLTQLGEAETGYEEALGEMETQLTEWEKELEGDSFDMSGLLLEEAFHGTHVPSPSKPSLRL